jgi:hypothetical protein
LVRLPGSVRDLRRGHSFGRILLTVPPAPLQWSRRALPRLRRRHTFVFLVVCVVLMRETAVGGRLGSHLRPDRHQAVLLDLAPVDLLAVEVHNTLAGGGGCVPEKCARMTSEGHGEPMPAQAAPPRARVRRRATVRDHRRPRPARCCLIVKPSREGDEAGVRDSAAWLVSNRTH